jgi:hypothetical protein
VKRSIREVQAVPEDSTTVRDPPGQGATRDVRIEDKRRAGTRELRDKVHACLNIPHTTAQVSVHVGAEGTQLIKDNRLQTVKRFLELWGFKQDETGRWQRGEAAASSGSARQTR